MSVLTKESFLKMGPELFEVNCGDEHRSNFGGSECKTLKLLSVRPEFEPYIVGNEEYSVFLQANVKLLIDGHEISLKCAPYQLPQEFYGLNIMVDLVKGVHDGLYPVKLNKDVRLAAKSAELPWLGKELAFPIKEYSWRPTNYVHTWNGFVHLHSEKRQIYYHRGEDFGAIPDRHDFIVMTDSVVQTIPPSEGDGGSNSITITDGVLRYRYAHANAHTIRRDLYEGCPLRKGEVIAKTGNTWNGRPVRDPHLHVGISIEDSGVPLNTYPLMASAYQKGNSDKILPVAGGYRFCLEGESIELDASRTIYKGNDRNLKFTWNFCDKSIAEGRKVKKHYPFAGTYTEELIVTDPTGQCERDYVIVFVTKKGGVGLPGACFNYYPIKDIKAGTEGEFLLNYANMTEVRVDFGDGNGIICKKEHFTHCFRQPGDYLVTAYGQNSQGDPGIFKVLVKTT